METGPERIDKALVLGGGGIAGVAWGCGYLEGLEEAGVTLTDADRVVGTSAGSIVAAWVTAGKSLHRRYAFLENAEHPLRRALTALFEASTRGEPSDEQREAMDLLFQPGMASPERLRRLGQISGQADTMPEALFVGFVASIVGRRDWRTDVLRLTAHDIETGERRVLQAGRHIGLGRACAASSSVPGAFPPVKAGGERLMDGGCRSGTNCDLAVSAQRALVLALMPLPDASLAPAVTEEIRELERNGTAVYAAWPGAEAVSATGDNSLDPKVVPAVARAGRSQGLADAPNVRALWTGRS